MKNIEKAFMNHTHVDKIRIAKFVSQTIQSTNDDIKAHNGTMNTVLGLLAKGDINCAGDVFDPNGNLFPEFNKTTVHPTNDQRPARQTTDLPAGVIRTEAEKQKAEEERRRQQEEEERARLEEERRQQEEEARIRKENSTWNKFKKGLLNFGKKIVEEED
jgi:cell division protein FtsA